MFSLFRMLCLVSLVFMGKPAIVSAEAVEKLWSVNNPRTLDKAAAAQLAQKMTAFETSFREIGRGERVASVPRSIQADALQWGFRVPECFRKPVLEGGYHATLCIAYLPDRRFPSGNPMMRCQWVASSNLHHPGYVCAAKSQLTEPRRGGSTIIIRIR
jgi:hypothetical protein